MQVRKRWLALGAAIVSILTHVFAPAVVEVIDPIVKPYLENALYQKQQTNEQTNKEI